MVVSLNGNLPFSDREVALFEINFITVRMGDAYGLLVNGVLMESGDIETCVRHGGGVFEGNGKRIDVKDFAFSDGVFADERWGGFAVLFDGLVIGLDMDGPLVDIGERSIDEREIIVPEIVAEDLQAVHRIFGGQACGGDGLVFAGERCVEIEGHVHADDDDIIRRASVFEQPGDDVVTLLSGIRRAVVNLVVGFEGDDRFAWRDVDGSFVVADVVVVGIGKRVVVEDQSFLMVTDDKVACA